MKTLRILRSPLELFLRCWVAFIFLRAGLAKLMAWPETLTLFRYEYHIPWLSTKFAAFLGTGLEIIVPILLIIGYGGRLVTLLLFIYNFTLAAMFPFVISPIGESSFTQHVNWALLLVVILIYGTGRWSVDSWLKRRRELLEQKRHENLELELDA